MVSGDLTTYPSLQPLVQTILDEDACMHMPGPAKPHTIDSAVSNDVALKFRLAGPYASSLQKAALPNRACGAMSSYESNTVVTNWKACACGDRCVHVPQCLLPLQLIGHRVCRDLFTQRERRVRLRHSSGIP